MNVTSSSSRTSASEVSSPDATWQSIKGTGRDWRYGSANSATRVASSAYASPWENQWSFQAADIDLHWKKRRVVAGNKPGDLFAGDASPSVTSKRRSRVLFRDSRTSARYGRGSVWEPALALAALLAVFLTMVTAIRVALLAF